MSARRQKPWSQHKTPLDRVDQGKSARKAQVEKALADTALFMAAKRLSSAAVMLSSAIPPIQQPHTYAYNLTTMTPRVLSWRSRARFKVLDQFSDEMSARFLLSEILHDVFWSGGELRTIFITRADRIIEAERELREAMAWARENLSPMAMMRLAATWPHNDWLPIDGEIE